MTKILHYFIKIFDSYVALNCNFHFSDGRCAFGQLKRLLAMDLPRFSQFPRKITNVLVRVSLLILKIVAGFLLVWIILGTEPIHITNSGIYIYTYLFIHQLTNQNNKLFGSIYNCPSSSIKKTWFMGKLNFVKEISMCLNQSEHSFS